MRWGARVWSPSDATHGRLVRPYVLPATRLVVELSPGELADLRGRLGEGAWRADVAAEYGLSVQQVLDAAQLDAADLAGELTVGRRVRHLRVISGGSNR